MNALLSLFFCATLSLAYSRATDRAVMPWE